jgi:hypothetical protein
MLSRTYCVHLQSTSHFCPENGGSIFPWNIGSCLPDCMVSLQEHHNMNVAQFFLKQWLV